MTQKDLFQKDQISSPLDIRVNHFQLVANRRGQEDPRHIFPYIFRIVEQTRPSFVIYENVYGHLSLGLDEVLFKMESIDYCTRTFVFPSSSIGAWHKRDRLWIICKSCTQHRTRWIIFPQGVQKQRRKCKKVTERDGRNQAI